MGFLLSLFMRFNKKPGEAGGGSALQKSKCLLETKPKPQIPKLKFEGNCCMFANLYVKTCRRPWEKAPLHPVSHSLNGVLQAQKGIGKNLTWICLLNLLSNLYFCLTKNRTTVHLCTTPGSMTMTEMMWVTAVTTARTTVTQTRQTQTVMERETPVLWTLMEMVRTKDYSIGER